MYIVNVYSIANVIIDNVYCLPRTRLESLTHHPHAHVALALSCSLLCTMPLPFYTRVPAKPCAMPRFLCSSWVPHQPLYSASPLQFGISSTPLQCLSSAVAHATKPSLQCLSSAVAHPANLSALPLLLYTLAPHQPLCSASPAQQPDARAGRRHPAVPCLLPALPLQAAR